MLSRRERELLTLTQVPKLAPTFSKGRVGGSRAVRSELMPPQSTHSRRNDGGERREAGAERDPFDFFLLFRRNGWPVLRLEQARATRAWVNFELNWPS